MAITKVSTAMKTAPTSAEVTAHVTAFDDTAVRNDISTLALHSAIADNKAAYNLSNAFIDQFEDDTGIDNETNIDRTSEEYMASVYEFFASPAWITTDRTSATTVTSGITFNPSPALSVLVDSDTSSNSSSTWPSVNDTSISSTVFLHFDFGSSYVNKTVGMRLYSQSSQTNNSQDATVKIQGSTDNSSWTDISGTMTVWAKNAESSPSVVQLDDATMNANDTSYRYLRAYGISGQAGSSGRWFEIQFQEKVRSAANNATGSFTSATQTALASVDTMGIVVLYKDNAGTATLNTDIVAQVSANGGTNYANATLVAGGTFSTGIKIAAVSGVSVTAGTTPKYKISFANQSSGSKETRVHGVALLY